MPTRILGITGIFIFEMDSMLNDELHRRGSSILSVFYTQENISSRFHDGSKVCEDNIKKDWVIRVTQKPDTGQWFTLNNRLLFAYRRHELWPHGNWEEHYMIDISLPAGKVRIVPFEECKEEFREKFTSTDNGNICYIRGKESKERDWICAPRVNRHLFKKFVLPLGVKDIPGYHDSNLHDPKRCPWLDLLLYTQESIDPCFHNGSAVHPENIEDDWMLHITQEPNTGRWFTLNNRLLYAYRKYYEEQLPGILPNLKFKFVKFENCKDEFHRKFTSKDNGRTCYIHNETQDNVWMLILFVLAILGIAPMLESVASSLLEEL